VADWPEAAELKQVLDVTSEDWDETLYRVLAAAIDKVKADVGDWDEATDTPDDRLAQAALRMGELIAQRPEAATETASDPTYRRLLFGHRRRFGVA
jgi:hypothetical protein